MKMKYYTGLIKRFLNTLLITLCQHWQLSSGCCFLPFLSLSNNAEEMTMRPLWSSRVLVWWWTGAGAIKIPLHVDHLLLITKYMSVLTFISQCEKKWVRQRQMEADRNTTLYCPVVGNKHHTWLAWWLLFITLLNYILHRQRQQEM